MFRGLCLAALLLQLPPSQDVTAEDLRVIDAALGHKARVAPGPPSSPLFLIDRTLSACKAGGSSINCVPADAGRLAFIQKRMPELTEAGMRTLAARNAEAQLLTSTPAADVVLTSREKLQQGSAWRLKGVHAYTSLPAYLDSDTAVIYLEFSCGGLCGEGNFLLLKRSASGWKVRKASMTWIS